MEPMVVRLVGDFDMTNRAELVHCFHLYKAGDRVVVDLSDVTFLDSSGVNALVQTMARGVVLVRGPLSPIAKRVLELTGVIQLMEPAST
jgi:anti-anti-sigma factor